ncbi:hypothetical protein H4R33_006157, partial [Dimargaris cristalligena]
ADFHNLTEVEPQPIRTITWIALIAALFAKVCGATLCFISANILISNSVPNQAALGAVNGFTRLPIAFATYLITFTWNPRINRRVFAETIKVVVDANKPNQVTV